MVTRFTSVDAPVGVPHPEPSEPVRSRKRLTLPWQVRRSCGSFARVTSAGVVMAAPGVDVTLADRARIAIDLAKNLGTVMGAGPVARLELQFRGKARCVVTCDPTGNIVATLNHSPDDRSGERARIPVAPSSLFCNAA